MVSFTRKDNMKRHALQVHKTIFRNDQSKDKRTPCHYQDCSQVFFQKVKLIKHIEECHEGIFSKESYNFLSESEFLAWKEKEELNSYVFFSKQTGSFFTGKNIKKDVKQVILFVKMMVILNRIALLVNQQEKLIKGTTEGVLNQVPSALPE